MQREAKLKDYAKPLQSTLAEAGLQGALQAGAYKVLLQYVADVDGELDVLYAVLDQLKASECSNDCMSAPQRLNTCFQQERATIEEVHFQTTSCSACQHHITCRG
jgi:hypothetical protein